MVWPSSFFVCVPSLQASAALHPEGVAHSGLCFPTCVSKRQSETSATRPLACLPGHSSSSFSWSIKLTSCPHSVQRAGFDFCKPSFSPLAPPTISPYSRKIQNQRNRWKHKRKLWLLKLFPYNCTAHLTAHDILGSWSLGFMTYYLIHQPDKPSLFCLHFSCYIEQGWEGVAIVVLETSQPGQAGF